MRTCAARLAEKRSRLEADARGGGGAVDAAVASFRADVAEAAAGGFDRALEQLDDALLLTLRVDEANDVLPEDEARGNAALDEYRPRLRAGALRAPTNGAIVAGKLRSKWERSIKLPRARARRGRGRPRAAADGAEGAPPPRRGRGVRKGAFTRAKAQRALGEESKAHADLLRAAKLDPQNRAVRAELKAVGDVWRRRRFGKGFLAPEDGAAPPAPEPPARRRRRRRRRQRRRLRDAAAAPATSDLARRGAALARGAVDARRSAPPAAARRSARPRQGRARSRAPVPPSAPARAGAVLGTDYGKWDKIGVAIEKELDSDEQAKPFEIPREHMEWMAQNGWLPGTVKFDEKRFEKKPGRCASARSAATTSGACATAAAGRSRSARRFDADAAPRRRRTVVGAGDRRAVSRVVELARRREAAGPIARAVCRAQRARDLAELELGRRSRGCADASAPVTGCCITTAPSTGCRGAPGCATAPTGTTGESGYDIKAFDGSMCFHR